MDPTAATYVLRVTSGPDAGLHVPFTGQVVVGRGEADIRLVDPAASRRHLILDTMDQGVRVTDADSRSGVRLNGRHVRNEAVARPGDTLLVGDDEMVLLAPMRTDPTGDAASYLLHRARGAEPARVPLLAELLVGRDESCGLLVDDASVSRRHAAIRRQGDALTVVDLESRNGTTVNGRRITGSRALRPGDELRFGRARDTVVVPENRGSQGVATELRITLEGEGATWSVHLDVPAGRSVGSVASALADFLGQPSDPRAMWGVYRADDGALPVRSDSWESFASARGDLIVVAPTPDLEVPVPVRPRSSGSDTVNVRPRASRPPVLAVVALPRPPESTSMRGRGVLWQLAGGAVAIVAAVALSFTFGPLALVGAVAGAAAMAFGVVGEQSRRRHQLAAYRAKVAAMDSALTSALTDQRADLTRLSPPTDELSSWVRSRGVGLWERRAQDADALALRLGVGRRAALLDVRDGGDADSGEHGRQAQELVAAARVLDGVPIITPTGGVLGIDGPREMVLDLAARLLVESAILHAPSAVGAAVVAVGEDWSWARWLPSVAAPSGPLLAFDEAAGERLMSELSRDAEVRARGRARTAQGAVVAPRRLVVLAHHAMRLSGADDLLTRWTPDCGLLVVLADDARELPPECTAIVHVTRTGAETSGSWQGGPAGAFVPDGMDAATAAQLSLELGRLRDPRAESGTSSAVGVLELSGAGDVGTLDLRQTWARTDRRPLESRFGVDDKGQPVVVDFRRDGPHAVVAGTTGAGKSELLLSLVTSLVATHPPDRLALFLIDFKGGATFGPLAQLPHVVGLVTDIEGDERLAGRAFVALEAELARRKRILSAAGVPDLVSYEALPVSGRAPVPPLLVAIDEFALLVSGRPDARSRLDSVATQGRSLGVHLVLATQSPAGVVTPAIRANTNLWLCLRVVSESESQEIIGRRDAALIPVEAPGRALMRRGAEESVLAFQTARVTSPADADAETLVTVSPFADGHPAEAGARHSVPSGRTELDALVAAAVDAWRDSRPTEPLWLPPLPAHVSASALPPSDIAGDLAVRIGMTDEPRLQRQAVWGVDLTDTNVAVSGVFSSGRSNVLRQIACELAERYRPDQVHVYAVDSRGSLSDLEVLPHVGAVIRFDERERLVRLWDRLVATLEHRRSSGPMQAPSIVLLLDDFPAFRELADDLLGGRLLEQLQSLATYGRGLGIHVVLATGQMSELRLALASQFQSRILLRQADLGDYVALDLRLSPDDLPAGLPGRALVTGGTEIQVAEPDVAAATALAQRWSDVSGPAAILSLPRNLSIDDPALASTGPRSALGLGGPELAPVLLDPRLLGPHLLVLGDSGSGRSTALDTHARNTLSADAQRSLVLVALRPGPLDPLRSDPRTSFAASTIDEIATALDRVEAAPATTLLVVDDAEAFPSRLGERLEALLRDARDSGLQTAFAARASDWVRLFDGWARYLTSLRAMLLLAPGPEASHLVDVRLPATVVPMVPGRGFLVDHGSVVLLQVARSDTSSTS